ncbi:MAG: DUF547 domain-containing protein [Mariprofundaceae bacterium]|nr:DUF547 domain-containing protein [Mariprofundaceae bacterium]
MKKIILIAALLIFNTTTLVAQAATPDWQGYAGLLHEHVHAGQVNDIRLHVVDYAAWKADPRWSALLAGLEDFDTATLENRKEKLSFWINVYNILAIKVVLDHAPLKSIRDAGSFFSPVWKRPAGRLAGKLRSLHEVEHEILRSMGDPRIHFAIVCASVSCPDLRTEPYRVATLETQLDDQARRFLNTPGKGLRADGKNVHISKIFDWFAEDFAPYGGVTTFIQHYHSEQPLKDTHLGYLDYDWQLNTAPTKLN